MGLVSENENKIPALTSCCESELCSSSEVAIPSWTSTRSCQPTT